ncbi:transposase [Saccharolobus caldissimus]|uniref:Transposase n=1 Tax=Saccharolobus caldissimus TaxID=1702097 RepID=A0AAQ4CWJ4_9CREN|nr:transposase [Saccharolobus caldissimus]BDC00176.1 transposase [Saccharolobus caldissimus]
MKESLIEAKIIDYGKLKDIQKEIIYYKLYVDALKKRGIKEKVNPPPTLPRSVLTSILVGGIPREGPLQIDFVNKDIIKIKEYNALVKSPEINSLPLYAIVEYRDDEIKVFLAYEEKPPIVGVDIGVRHLITVVALKDSKLWKVRFFSEPKVIEYFTNFLGDQQGIIQLEEIRNKAKKMILEAVNFIESLEPKIVAMENLDYFDTKPGRGLRVLQNMLEIEMRKRGVKYKKLDPYNTSRICAKCGYKKGEIMGSLFVCPACGYKADRDFNAAYNIALKCYYTC